jgi:hypothetical protein
MAMLKLGLRQRSASTGDIRSVGISIDNARVYGLRALPPALALTDLYGEPKAWHPDIPAHQASAIWSASQLLSVDLPPASKNELENSQRVCLAIGTNAR